MNAIELLESALKTTRRRQMTRCQVLVLIALAKAQRPLRMSEIYHQYNEHRQTFQKAVYELDHSGAVKVKRYHGVRKTMVHMQKEGEMILREIFPKPKTPPKKRKRVSYDDRQLIFSQIISHEQSKTR